MGYKLKQYRLNSSFDGILSFYSNATNNVLKTITSRSNVKIMPHSYAFKGYLDFDFNRALDLKIIEEVEV